MARRPETQEKQERQQKTVESPNGAFKITSEGAVEGRPNLQKLQLSIIDGEIVPLIYDATARRLLVTPNYQRVEKLQGLEIMASSLLESAGVAVPVCMDCEFTMRVINTDGQRQFLGCPQRCEGPVCEGCGVPLCRHFRELSEARRKDEADARAAEVQAEKEYKEQERLEELERQELKKLRRKYGRRNDNDQD